MFLHSLEPLTLTVTLSAPVWFLGCDWTERFSWRLQRNSSCYISQMCWLYLSTTVNSLEKAFFLNKNHRCCDSSWCSGQRHSQGSWLADSAIRSGVSLISSLLAANYPQWLLRSLRREPASVHCARHTQAVTGWLRRRCVGHAPSAGDWARQPCVSI